MKKRNAVQQYKKWYIDDSFERLRLFSVLAEKYSIDNALYPGSFLHITPSLVFPSVTYIEIDKRAKAFFGDSSIYDYISKHKIYESSPEIHFLADDFLKKDLKLDKDFDLLISQYAGFVSHFCKQYLKIGGLLLANNSFGDASMASIDRDFRFIGVLNKRGDNYSFSEKDLDSYFIPKKPLIITKEYIAKICRGIGYTKSPTAYLFKKIG